MCNGRADEHDDWVSTEQSEFPETSTGSDGEDILGLDESRQVNELLDYEDWTFLLRLPSSAEISTARKLPGALS